MEHHQQQRHLRFGGVQAHQLLNHDHVRRTRNWKQFGQPLHDGQDDDFDQVFQGTGSSYRTRAGMGRLESRL